MATMATKSATGGTAAAASLTTPHASADPSNSTSRQTVSREPSATMNNNPYDASASSGGSGVGVAAGSSSGGGVVGGNPGVVGGIGVGRGERANSLVEAPASAAAPRSSADARSGEGGGLTAAAADSGTAGDVATTDRAASAAVASSSSVVAPAAGASNSNPTSSNNSPPNPNAAETISYSAERIIGNGSFGVVFQASVVETGEIVAIKKVLQDKRFKNRELQIMRQLVKDGHSNIVALKHCFYSQGEKQDELYLNLVLEYVPETVYSISRHHQKSKMALPLLYVKLYLYQLSRALSHIHHLGICHRDIKPQNLLVNPENQQLKLCDFGSAKALVRGEPNVSYICSRYYRAPELIFGSTDYSTAIDIWSQGCVGAELLLGQPLFPGDSGVDQLVEIIKVLGTPTREEISSMNSNYTEFKFPQIKACQWRKVFRSKTPDEAMDFIGSTLAYDPERRIRPLEGCGHPFFDECREEGVRLPNGNAPPPLFDFTHHELASSPELLSKLIPPHVKIENIGKGDSKPHAR
mmetsp:Transcript_29786/g.54730  ORF Transcript_29786/g.54730 Transcript_29786/m.54730 type:complete len:524 (+) Transcript_29786:367-1938(+)